MVAARFSAILPLSINLSSSMQGLEGGLQMFYFLFISFGAFQ
jgi:hypothetical protein